MKLRPDDLLGPYRIVDLLGSGGMGEVYRAIDPRLGRHVAIKVLAGDGLSAEAAARFAAETRAVAALPHPNITAIYDVGNEQGMRYAVMELLEGETLATKLQTGPLPPGDAVEAALQIAQGLAAAHERGIVHRDLKPSNVFVLHDRRVKLLDFGVAKVIGTGRLSDATTAEGTLAGTIVGTVGYMAPEQVRAEPCDARTDVFAFGVVFYEMLTGRRAFEGRTPLDTIAAILKNEPALEAMGDAPTSVRRLIRRCLDKTPEERFQSARELIAALETTSTSTRAIQVGASVPSMAVLPFADMSRDRDQDYLCEGIAEEIITALSRLPGLRVVSRTAAFRVTGAQDLRRLGEELNVQYALEGSARTAGNRLRLTARLTAVADNFLLWSDAFDRDLSDVFAVQEDIARTVVDALRVKLEAPAERLIVSTTKVTDAYTAYLKGRHHWNRRTQSGLDTAIRYFTEAITADPQYGPAYAGLADAYAMLAVYGLAAPAEVMPRARATAIKTLELCPDLAEAHVSLGLVQALHEWAWQDAERSFLRAMALSPNYAVAYQSYALNCLVPQGQFPQATEMLTRALTIDPLLATATMGVGVVRYFEGRFDDASGILQQVLEDHEGLEPAHFFLALAHAENGAVDAARRQAERAMDLSAGSAETIAALGYIEALAGNRSAAAEALALLQRMAASRYVSSGLAAQVHAALGEDDRALALLGCAADVRATDLAWVGVRPAFRGLRGHPAFAGILRRVRLL